MMKIQYQKITAVPTNPSIPKLDWENLHKTNGITPQSGRPVNQELARQKAEKSKAEAESPVAIRIKAVKELEGKFLKLIFIIKFILNFNFYLTQIKDAEAYSMPCLACHIYDNLLDQLYYMRREVRRGIYNPAQLVSNSSEAKNKLQRHEELADMTIKLLT